MPEMYLAAAQVPDPGMNIVLRTNTDLTGMSERIKSIVRNLDGTLAVSNLRTLSSVVDESVAPRKYYTVLMGVFAAVAMALAAVGIFGVISVTVMQRKSEIGVRVALGAAPGSILNLVIGNALRLVGLGLGLGILGSFWLTTYVETLLYEVTPNDPFTLAGSAAILLFAALAASAFPAWQAARVDPLVALRGNS